MGASTGIEQAKYTARLGVTPPVSPGKGVYQGSATQLLDLVRRAPPAEGRCCSSAMIPPSRNSRSP